ncbi:hypothetical protein CIB48_g2410 [Xylaria polymorpha]|nr:hypothetical protein CIB48_g2410 [Xylaria polymorpha]
MATNTADFPLATDDPYAGSSPAPGAVDDAAGVVILGISTAVLFYLAKKREWKVRESIRRSARKVVTALTPRRTEFPRSAKESSGRSSRGRVRLDDVPPTPKLRSEDVEKGLAKAGFRQVPDGRGKKWTKK